MKLYEVFTGYSDAGEFFASKREAVAYAKRMVRENEIHELEVDLTTLVPMTKYNVIQILKSHGGMYAAATETVVTIRRKETQYA